MRNMSFHLTTPQFKDGSKDVTRRIGWAFLKEDELVCAVERGQGLRKGEQVRRLGVIRIVDVRREPLSCIRHEHDGCRREGFPQMTPDEFIAFWLAANGGREDRIVTRVQFTRLVDYAHITPGGIPLSATHPPEAT